MAITAGSSLNTVPASQKYALISNYVDFTDGSTGWEQQYKPEIMDKEAEVFGNRTISGFLNQVGAEESMTSDQVIWSEQGRLHVSVVGSLVSGTSIFTVTSDIDGNNASSSPAFTLASHGVRLNDMVLVAVAGYTLMCHVTLIDGAAITCQPYGVEHFDDTSGISGTYTATMLVVGSEFKKGTRGHGSYNDVGTSPTNTLIKSAEPTHKTFNNKPVIIKDYYEVSGSDASQIGWIEVASEDGPSGYLWYLKGDGDTRNRFSDHLEMVCVEAEKTNSNSHIVNAGGTDDAYYESSGLGSNSGTEGLFSAVSTRGNVASGITGISGSADLSEFDAILAEFDKQGSIEENMLFVNRTSSLAIDDMLASMNSYGTGGTSYGVFNNSEDMALNLGFSGFRRGSYDFYKSDWKYLNDKATRGAINDRAATGATRGIFIPAGVSSVYDQQLGKNLKRPFLHVRYRASQTENRKYKTWVTGSVGGATTSDLDALQINYLSERCLVVQGANNFMLLK
tara:strand:- start:900 stop:2423 length:1524 start_codon:yes stop_codon:yes gene_type:complete